MHRLRALNHEEQGNSLKKCDLPESSYGNFEDAAGLNPALVVGVHEERLSLILRLKQSNSSVQFS
jgi:hypothetical protein